MIKTLGGVEARQKLCSGLASLHATAEYSYQHIVELFGLHFTTIGKIVRAARAVNRMQKDYTLHP